MSHFYLYPLLHSQGYQHFQIQQILHSFGRFTDFQMYSPSTSPFLSLGQNAFNKRSYSKNLILQQNHQNLFLYNSLSQNQNDAPIQNLDCENNDLIKEEHAESQDKTPERQQIEKYSQKLVTGSKNRKKKKITKMSLKEKRQKQLKRNQTENSKRNVIPNQIHQMLSILFKKKKSCHMVQKLIQKYSSLNEKSWISVQRFYLYQSLLKEKINHYANEQSLKILLEPLQPSFRIYSKEQQSLYSKIGLSLINYFLNTEATLVILNSKRIKSENKLEHLKTKRYLSYVLKEMVSSKCEDKQF